MGDTPDTVESFSCFGGGLPDVAGEEQLVAHLHTEDSDRLAGAALSLAEVWGERE